MKITIVHTIDDEHVSFLVAAYMRKPGQATKREFNKFLREHVRKSGQKSTAIDGATEKELHLARNLMKKWKLV